MAEVIIKIWNKEVGAAIWNKDKQVAIFEFSKEFIKEEIDLAPIIMPLEAAIMGKRIYSFPNLNLDTFKKLPGLLSDSLPDKFGNTLIDLWLSRNGRSPNDFTPIERLCYVGSRAMGALEFEPTIKRKSNEIKDIQLGELVEIAAEIMNKKESLHTSFKKNKTKAIEQIISVGTSAGGMRPKAVIAIHKNNRSIVSGNLDLDKDYEHWLLKFDGIQDNELGHPQGYGKIEYVYNLLAKECGIEMSECALLNESGRNHFMTKRFDRVDGQKIHMQTLTGIAHFDFNNIGSTSYEQLFQVMRKLKLGKDQLEQMFRRMIFNVVGRNQDDHTKNTSFILPENGEWRLSPAYDITYSFNPIPGRNTNMHQMSINGKRKDFSKKDLIKIAKDNMIKKPNEIIEEVVSAISKWKVKAKENEIATEKIKKIESNLKLNIK
jgi:serine/threonine-protein kinase HipA